MKKILLNSIKYVMVAIIIIMTAGLNDCKVLAADANVTVSSPSVEEGSEVDVNVTISSAEKMAGYNILLTYDANLLEYVSGADGGGNGAVKLLNELFEDTSVTRTLKFKAKKAGSVAIKVDTATSSIIDMAVEDCKLIATDGTVTINAKVTSSSNNFLSSLEVVGVREDGTTQAYNITQRETNVVGFDKNQVKYMGYVATDIVKFAVTAIPEDNTATVNITGVDLAEGGANVTTITVTAQNGEVRTYVINTYRVPGEGDEPETPAEPETPVEPETPNEPESETTAPTLVDKEVTIGNDIYVITSIAEDTVIPEGFSRFEYTYDGQVYVAAKGEAKKLTIMQLVKKGTEDKGLYVFDEANNVFYKFVNIQIINKMYTVTEKPEDVEISDDFEETLVNIEGEMLNIWANKAEDGIYLFYGMNWNGEQGLYLYDSKEKTAMRYLALTSSEVSGTVAPEPDNNNDETTVSVADDTDDSKKNIIIFAEAGVIVVLIIVIIILIIKSRSDYDYDDESQEFDDDDEKKDKNTLSDEELLRMDADAMEDELYEKSESFNTDGIEEVKESENIEKAFEYIMEMEAAKEAMDASVTADEEVSEEIEKEAIEETTEEIEKETIEETKEKIEKETIEETAGKVDKETMEEAVEGYTKEINKELTEEVVEEVADEISEEAVEEVVEDKSVELSSSIEEMLMDSSTSLNDDELDMVLDKLLGDE